MRKKADFFFFGGENSNVVEEGVGRGGSDAISINNAKCIKRGNGLKRDHATTITQICC